jgi:hypothetical protein
VGRECAQGVIDRIKEQSPEARVFYGGWGKHEELDKAIALV